MRLLIIFISFIISINLSQAEPLALTAERIGFLQAQSALVHGNEFNFKIFSSQLHQYILYPYLQYDAITHPLTIAKASQVNYFLKTYADTPLAEHLRTEWLNVLANNQQWQGFLNYYRLANNTTLQCYYAQALWETQQKSLGFKEISKIWLNTNLLPEACMPMLKNWRASGELTADLAWQRVQLNITTNQPIDKKLLTLLPIALQTRARFWEAVRKNAEWVIKKPALFAANDKYTHEILLDSVTHYINQKPQQAAAAWGVLQNQYDFSPAEQQIIIRKIAIELARSADPVAYLWLSKIKPIYVNELVKIWRIRTALIHQNWPMVNTEINQLPLNERQQPIWRYWHARALAKTGQLAQANLIYHQLAQQVNYYGLLASEQLHIHYQPLLETNGLDKQRILNKINTIPALQRAHELYVLKMVVDARREWQWAIKQMNPLELRTAAELAMQWNWFDRALITAAKAGDYDFTVRFPLAYRQQVILAAQQVNLDPAWMLAIMRQESGFMPDAKSSVGALGLMQVMPATARLISANLSDYGMLDINTNINLGTRYLKQLSNEYAGNKTLSTAAYNIGPTRLQKWLPLYKKLPVDIWIDILPWQETRNYVQTVTLAMVIYRQRLHEV